MDQARIAVCDDEMLIRLWLEEHLSEADYVVSSFETGRDLLESLPENPVDLILLDLRLPDGSGLDILREVKETHAGTSVIMISAYGEVEIAVEAVRSGAYHFLEKPIELPELLLLVDQALANQDLVGELGRYREGNEWRFRDVVLVGRSHAIRSITEVITRLALRGSPTTVLIRGESGTGKDVVARALHARGPRRDRPFISVNCSALPEHLVESELFGHEAGAFTDARDAKRGLFELAHRGTLFLDEIGDMQPVAQSKLLRVLETHSMRRVGGVKDIPVDVHVITATNRDLDAAAESGAFRRDLFYRLNVIPIEVPPLRERRDDIIPLAQYFADTLSREMRLPSRLISPQALRALEAYSWPGNARQLRNVLERILLMRDDETIDEWVLPPEIRVPRGEGDGVEFALPLEGVDLESVERELISQALTRAEGNKSSAARLLRLSRDKFRYRLEKHGLRYDAEKPDR